MAAQGLEWLSGGRGGREPRPGSCTYPLLIVRADDPLTGIDGTCEQNR